MREIIGFFVCGIGAEIMRWGLKIGGKDVKKLVAEQFIKFLAK